MKKSFNVITRICDRRFVDVISDLARKMKLYKIVSFQEVFDRNGKVVAHIISVYGQKWIVDAIAYITQIRDVNGYDVEVDLNKSGTIIQTREV